MMRGLCVLLIWVVCARAAAAQTPVPVLVIGQSNANMLSVYGQWPADTHVRIARNGTEIRYFDWELPEGDLGRQLLDLLQVVTPNVVVWWQGEADGQAGTPDAEYEARLIKILLRIQRPVILMGLTSYKTNVRIRAIHQRLAGHPLVAFLPTWDLSANDTMHLDYEGGSYVQARDRIQACILAQCWLTQ